MPLTIADKYRTYKILGIDPGLNTTGVSIFNIDSFNDQILSIDAFTINTDLVYNNTGLYSDLHTDRQIKLYKLKEVFQRLLYDIKPNLVACESPFYNRFRPMAFGALLEVIGIIQNAVVTSNSNIVFKTVEPLLVKKTVGAGFKKGKIDVKKSVQRIDVLNNVLMQDINQLDEHSIDAIAVSYTYYINYLIN